MTNDAKIIIEKATKLPPEDREVILEAMLASLHQDASAQVDQAWRDLIDERLAKLDKGEGLLFDFDEAIGELRHK
jgi:putative addiction module component (TIGR02574 family)